MNMTITEQNFLSDTAKHLSSTRTLKVASPTGNRIFLSAKDTEYYETMQAIKESEADFAAGRTFTHEQIKEMNKQRLKG